MNLRSARRVWNVGKLKPGDLIFIFPELPKIHMYIYIYVYVFAYDYFGSDCDCNVCRIEYEIMNKDIRLWIVCDFVYWIHLKRSSLDCAAFKTVGEL